VTTNASLIIGLCHVSGTTKPEREEIRLNFNKLVYARYVERCPKPEPQFTPDEEPKPAKRRVQKVCKAIPCYGHSWPFNKPALHLFMVFLCELIIR
jgi:hypothetical protein